MALRALVPFELLPPPRGLQVLLLAVCFTFFRFGLDRELIPAPVHK